VIWLFLGLTVVMLAALGALALRVMDIDDRLATLIIEQRAARTNAIERGPTLAPVCDCGGTWGKWTTGEAKRTVRYISGDAKTVLEEAQWRTCTECGFVEKRRIANA
jgi:hypothetical protein